jgi:hypothetical protein
VSSGTRVFVDQAAQEGFSVDPFAVEVGNGEVATVGDALGDSLVRPVLQGSRPVQIGRMSESCR